MYRCKKGTLIFAFLIFINSFWMCDAAKTKLTEKEQLIKVMSVSTRGKVPLPDEEFLQIMLQIVDENDLSERMQLLACMPYPREKISDSDRVYTLRRSYKEYYLEHYQKDAKDFVDKIIEIYLSTRQKTVQFLLQTYKNIMPYL